jgi:hypothetical protein
MVVRKALEHTEPRAKGFARTRRQRLAGKPSHLSTVLDCPLTRLLSTRVCDLSKTPHHIPGPSDT